MIYRRKRRMIVLCLSIIFAGYLFISWNYGYRLLSGGNSVEFIVSYVSSISLYGGLYKVYTIYTLFFMIMILVIINKCNAQKITKGTRAGYINKLTIQILLSAILVSFLFNLIELLCIHQHFTAKMLWDVRYYFAQLLDFLHFILCFFILGQFFILLYVITQKSWVSAFLVIVTGIGIMFLDYPLLFYQVDVFQNLYGTYSDHLLHFSSWCWMMIRFGIVSFILYEISKKCFQRRSLLK
ncbi:hypothetical protein DWW36_05850 [Erysipelotrichaceae bacterium AF15-26LB]|nr:hypothetical protein HMPREF0983_00012 [Erysipelotrichaceae bacterium 3_1_53]RJV90860.1 hypothetical protein DWW36_05850 [Erysipelotrichaceae bacterium AF15-26LB]RJV93553.1 hypothetical protein DWX45_01740 [Erysipelotrichaceae bacterium AF19-24AC]